MNHLMIDLETLNWAREHGTYPHDVEKREVCTGVALQEFLVWYDENVKSRDEVEVWAWGLDFDIPITRARMAACGIPVPWSHGRVNDARTIWKRSFPGEYPIRRPHDALADCLAQVADLSRAWNHIRKGGRA